MTPTIGIAIVIVAIVAAVVFEIADSHKWI